MKTRIEERNPDMLRIDDLMEYFIMGRRQAYLLCQRTDFPAFRVGKIIRIRRQDLERWVEDQSKKPCYVDEEE